MAKKYDVIVVGAGPAGFLAAKAAGENGLEVALLERKSDPKQLTRACGQTLVSMNEYYFGDLVGYNNRDKRIFFPVYSFSFKYDGPHRNVYSTHIYTPNGHKIEFGDCEEQRKKGDYGRVGLTFDKEILFQCLLEEVTACGVDVFPGINVEKVTTLGDRVRAEGSGQSFDGAYLIAADGVNSRVAQVMGFNKDRVYYYNFHALSWYMSGVELPERDVFIYTHGFPRGTGAMCFIVPQATEGEYNIIVTTGDPRLDLEVAVDYFMKRKSCASWFEKAKKLKALSAVNNMYSPIVEPYKDRVLVAGDVGATFELEITGAMISGWKAGQAISTAVQEENLGLEVTAISLYDNWWKEIYVNRYEHDPRRMFALLYALTKEEEIDYVLGLIKDTLPASWNPGTIGRTMGEAMGKVIPIIQQERPETFQKLQRASMLDEIFTELTKVSKPVQ